MFFLLSYNKNHNVLQLNRRNLFPTGLFQYHYQHLLYFEIMYIYHRGTEYILVNRSTWTKKAITNKVLKGENTVALTGVLDKSLQLISHLGSMYRQHSLDYLINRGWHIDVAKKLLLVVNISFSTLLAFEWFIYKWTFSS
jgi:hypothetical protein